MIHHIEWGEWQEAVPFDRNTALHYRAKRHAEDGLEFEARVVQDTQGVAGFGIVIAAYYGQEELAQAESFALDQHLAGFPENSEARAFAHAVVNQLLMLAKHQAHHGIRRIVNQARTRLHRLQVIEQAMGQVELWHEQSHRINLTLNMAHSVISRATEKGVVRPFRFELARPNYAAVFDHENKRLGYILFNPTLPDARMGLVYVSVEEHNRADAYHKLAPSHEQENPA
jgi:hypothetical protein